MTAARRWARRAAVALDARLEGAFGAERLPDDVPVAASVRDPAEARVLCDALQGRVWTEVSEKWVAANWAALTCYLTPVGFRHFLPAQLRSALRALPDGPDVMSSVTFGLTPSWWCIYYEGADVRHQSLVDALNDEQFDVVCEFLAISFHTGHAFRAAQALRWGWTRRDTVHHACMHSHYAKMYGHRFATHSEPEVVALIESIEAAWATAICPPDNELCGSSLDDEPAGYALEFRGQDWRTLHPEFLSHNSAALSFLSTSGFCHFLPAFLIADLHDCAGNGDPVFHLTYVHGDDREHSRERLASLGLCQREVVVRYLEYVAAQGDWDGSIKKALSSFWHPLIASGEPR